MSKMRVVQVTHQNGPLEIVVRETPEPVPVQCALKWRRAGTELVVDGGMSRL
jgi:hypothetical protein